MKKRNSKLIASIGTVLFMLIVFLLLWFLMIGYMPEQEDEGVMVSFGETEIGGGQENGLVAAAATSQPAYTPPPAPAPPSDNELMTQEDEEALAIRRHQEEERRRAEAEARAEQERERAEQERLEQERLAEERRIAEENARKQAAIDKANQMGALFGQTHSPEGSGGTGESASSAAKGNPLGHGNSGGNSWSLNGRSIVGALPAPSNDFKQEGRVVVNITVDTEGRVISAVVGPGSTISDYATQQLAIKAALKAKFNVVDRPDKAMGTITYNFKFK